MAIIPAFGHEDDITIDEYDDGSRIDEYIERTPTGEKRLPEQTKYRVIVQNEIISKARFDELDKARLWLDVYYDVGGFQEQDTGRFGIPARVAAAGKDTLSAYLMTQEGMDPKQVAEFFDVERQTIYVYCSRVRNRAKEARENASSD